mmetsp:Transcript_16149/g.22436  ORF Transcript_16149/g.22436 Transcript_16149/m.22436 type:complete len:305 (-) Transcript_16149:33-947(-)
MRRIGKFADEYELQKSIGSRRGTCEVFIATRKKDGTNVAVKRYNSVIKVNKLKEESSKQLTKLKHRNIISVEEILVDEKGTIYVVDELFLCQTLKYFKDIPKAEREVAVIMKQALFALRYMHSQKMILGNIELHNLFLKSNSVGESITIKLSLDSYARLFEAESSEGALPFFLAPEVLTGEEFNERCDLWTAGVLCYLLLCGYPPFYGDSLVKLFESITQVQYDFNFSPWDTISDEAKEFIRKLIVREPSKRMSISQALRHPFLVNWDWNRRRLVWVGWMKNDPKDCILAVLPKELIRHLVSFL